MKDINKITIGDFIRIDYYLPDAIPDYGEVIKKSDNVISIKICKAHPLVNNEVINIPLGYTNALNQISFIQLTRKLLEEVGFIDICPDLPKETLTAVIDSKVYSLTHSEEKWSIVRPDQEEKRETIQYLHELQEYLRRNNEDNIYKTIHGRILKALSK